MNDIITVNEYVKQSNIGSFVLDDQAMCANKWTFLYVDFHSGTVKNCFNVPNRKITEKEIFELGTKIFFNHPYELERRQEKLDNIKHSDCQNCWTCESKGIQSNRRPNNYYELHRSRFNVERGLTPLPTFLELYFSNLCDLKCVYCDPQFSSQWESEKKKYNEPVDISKDTTNGSLTDIFYKWFEEDGCKNIITYNILGGEPTIQNKFYEFAEYLINCLDRIPPVQKIKPEIRIITNGNTPPHYMDKLISILERLSEKLSIKIDFSNGSIGKRAEFIRSNLDWNTFEKNVNRIAEFSKGKDVHIKFNCAHNLLTVPTFLDFLKWAHELQNKHSVNVYFSTNTVVQPFNLSPWNLTEDFKQTIDDCIQWINESAPEWIKYIEYLETLKNGIGKYSLEDIKTIPHWAAQMKERRGLDFLETFPELSDWYKFCQQLSDNTLK